MTRLNPEIDPSQRPYRRRRSVRLLVIDPAGRTLLFSDRDVNNELRWWITPGGGVEPGESLVAAALRELAEETGRVIEPEQLLGPIATQRVLHGFSDQVTDQLDTYFVVRVPAFDVDRSAHTEQELVTMVDDRWVELDWLRTTPDLIWPTAIVALRDLADRPDLWPANFPDVEESSVPVGLGHLPIPDGAH